MKVRLQGITTLLIAGVLSACASIPTSGPSTSTLQDGPKIGIRVVDVDDSIARQVLDSRAPMPFSAAFREISGNNETVGPGDVLEISIWEAPPGVLFSSAVRDPTSASSSAATSSTNVSAFPQQMISGAGTIYVPFAGTVQVAGKTLVEIESDITHQLQGKANQPQVLVRLTANNTSCATVIGEVASSMRMPLTPRGERLLDALAAAGGTKEPVDKITVQLTRGTSVRALPLDTVIRDPRQNIRLQPGDVVTALFEPLSFTALGATGKSDEVNFEAQGISLAQALARAGGVLDNRSDAAGVFIFRFESKDTLKLADVPASTPDGKIPVIYRVNLRDPRAFFVAQSFPMQNKDVLYVANAPAAQLQKFLNLIVSTVYPIQGVVTLTK
jgi:polysaccharide export outer membrane protein